MAAKTYRGEELRGAVVRDRAAELGLTLEDISAMTQIPARTLHNTTRDVRPDRMRRYRIIRLARALHLPVAEIAATNDGVPDEPPQQPKAPPGPARRKEKPSGPKRAQDSAVA